MAGASPHVPRIGVTMRDREIVSPLELFFDLVFVLAITQCTALMAKDPTWNGIGSGLVVLGLLWWSWVGYAWLTSVVDPDEGAVRLVVFAAMAALLVTSLCVPYAYGYLVWSSPSPTAAYGPPTSPCSSSPAVTTLVCATPSSGWRRAPHSAWPSS